MSGAEVTTRYAKEYVRVRKQDKNRIVGEAARMTGGRSDGLVAGLSMANSFYPPATYRGREVAA